MERRIRADKRTQEALEAAGDTEGAKAVKKRIAAENKALHAYCDKEGLAYRQDRTQIYGYTDPKRKKKAVDFVETVDNSGKSCIINTNKAKVIDVFNDTDLKTGDPTVEEIVAELSNSSIGKETAELISELLEGIILTQGREPDVRGEEKNGKICIYVNNCRDVKWVARTIIHEHTHYRYGIGESQWAECVCIAQELKHARNRDYLTVAEKRMIIKAVKGDSDYKKLNWRNGGLINGRRKSHR